MATALTKSRWFPTVIGMGSLVAFIRGRKQFANLMGEWVPTFLLLGMYNKFVKEATHLDCVVGRRI